MEVQDDWWFQSVYEDAKEVGKLLGIEIKDIEFSGAASGFFNPEYWALKQLLP